MRRINNLFFLNYFNKFKIITDENDTEYVVFENSTLSSVTGINDKTEFEALENHMHILDNISLKEFKMLLPIAEALGNMLLCCLKQKFPSKDFIVFVSMRVRDSLVIRFHQKWENEKPYYNPDDYVDATEKVFWFGIDNTRDSNS